MLKKFPLLLSALFLLALNIPSIHANTRTVPAALLVSPRALGASEVDEETDRSRDGLQGPVRRVRIETSKLMSKGGKLTEGARSVLETATYDMKGTKIDTAYFLGTGGSLTGKEVYKYDDKGNIVEMTLFNTDGSVVTKEKYDYEFDAMGNWTKMTTSVALIENGQMSFEPTEVTYRVIAYYLEDTTAKKLQTASLASNTNAAASVAPASLSNSTPANAPNNMPANASNNKLAAPSVAASSAPQPKTIATPAASANNITSTPKATANNAAPNVKATNSAPIKQANNAPTLPTVSGVPAASSNLALGMPNVAAAPANNNAPVVKATDDVPPPPVKPIVKAPARPVSSGVLNGKAVEMPKPVYPEMARRARLIGLVTVEVVVDVSGKVIGARAVNGPDMLRDAAERAARQARFTPATIDGRPVRVSGVINYNFSL